MNDLKSQPHADHSVNNRADGDFIPAGTLDAGSVALTIKMYDAFTGPLLQSQAQHTQRLVEPEVASTLLCDWSTAQVAEWVKQLGEAYEEYSVAFLKNGTLFPLCLI